MISLRRARLFGPLLVLAGCATSSPFFHADLVSMTRYSYSGGGLAIVGPVNEQFCNRDEPIYGKNKSTGMMDELIYKAQKKMKADYIANANFTYIEWSWGRDCLQMEGMAVRKKALQGPTPSSRHPSSVETPADEIWLQDDADSIAPVDAPAP